MKSGLEGRNNFSAKACSAASPSCLNEVRPRRPEQSRETIEFTMDPQVSMKSGLEGRNNDIILDIPVNEA